MIARAITSIIGVVIGLFATFAVFSAILGGLDSFYLLTQDACNYGSDNSPKRALRVAPENPDHPGDADEIDWSRDGLDVVQSGLSCAVDGANALSTYLTPTGDEFTAPANINASLPSTAFTLPAYRDESGVWLDGDELWFLSTTGEVDVYNIPSGSIDSTKGFSLHVDSIYAIALYGTEKYIYVVDNSADKVFVYDRSDGSLQSGLTITLDSDNEDPTDLVVVGSHVYVTDLNESRVFAYRLSDRSYDSTRNLQRTGEVALVGIDYDGEHTYYMYVSSNKVQIEIAPGFTSVDDARAAGTLVVRPLDPSYSSGHGPISVRDGRFVYVGAFGRMLIVDLGVLSVDYTWTAAENVFTAQEQLVTLLAVIAAIGMPIGAMTAIVFFGQAVISSGIGGSGASQVMVAIAAVVVILVSIQMFQQFAGFLGNAFDAVNGDRFVVFDETLGSLAETIAEFWGVLAFAGFINIASIVWRNYSGNFSIGGTQGGL